MRIGVGVGVRIGVGACVVYVKRQDGFQRGLVRISIGSATGLKIATVLTWAAGYNPTPSTTT